MGLNQTQAKVYLTLLQLGSGYIQEIAKKSALKRTTTYSILDTLVQKGLVSYSKKKAHREYAVEDPKKIPKSLNKEIDKIKQTQQDVLEILPELSSLYNVLKTKPTIRYFEGIEGLKQVFEETLELKKGEEILAYSTAVGVHQYLDEYIPGYIIRRAKGGIWQRDIVEDSAEARRHQKNDQVEFRETRILPTGRFPFSNEINIFGNKMGIISYKELFGVIIESAEIAKTQKTIFELAWYAADKLQVKE